MIALVGCSMDGPQAGPPLQQRIDDAVYSVQGDTCFAQADTSACEWADYEIGPAEFAMARSTGESILVIDSIGAGSYPELVRYRNRVRGFYVVDGDHVAARVLSVRLPRRLGDVLVSFAGPEFIPARDLSPLVGPIADRYSKLNLLYYGHGGLVLGNLLELVPEQPLVLMDLTGLFDFPTALCQSVDAQSMAAATAHFAAIAASLRQIMAEHGVRFINASFGATTATLAADWMRICGSPAPDAAQLRPLLHMYDPIFDLLFDSDGVITAHAAARRGEPADFPFDQVSASYPNRMRVGFISSLSSGLDDAGRGPVQKVEQFPDDGDADVYLNWGCETLGACADRHYEIAGEFGAGTFPLPVMSSSYINPLALARLINLRYANHADQAMNNDLIHTLEREMTPPLCGAGGIDPCVYQDPIAHGQLEVLRLHYR